VPISLSFGYPFPIFLLKKTGTKSYEKVLRPIKNDIFKYRELASTNKPMRFSHNFYPIKKFYKKIG